MLSKSHLSSLLQPKSSLRAAALPRKAKLQLKPSDKPAESSPLVGLADQVFVSIPESIKEDVPQEESISVSQVPKTAERAEPSKGMTSPGVSAGPNGTLLMNIGSGSSAESTETSDGFQVAALSNEASEAVSLLGAGAQIGWLKAAGAFAGLALLGDGARRAVQGTSVEAQLEGLSDTKWGLQSVLSSAKPGVALSEMVATCAKVAGVAGGAIQAGIGVKGLYDGAKAKDLEKAALGGADILAGSSWILASLGVASGVTLPAFIGLTLASKAYKNRESIRMLVSCSADDLSRRGRRGLFLASKYLKSRC